MGGCIAQVFAARHPDRVAGLVLADTFDPDPLSRSEWLQRSVLLRAAVLPVRAHRYERVDPRQSDLFTDAVRRLLGQAYSDKLTEITDESGE